ncbi:MAG: hypothetical protein JWQ07_1070 [Ramlibacter sp.]|nr:hypothetical protein [Ramlibacter sp.]
MLEALRAVLLEAIRKNASDESILIAHDHWYAALKHWERADTFQAALDDGRMTARVLVNPGASMVRFEIPQRPSFEETKAGLMPSPAKVMTSSARPLIVGPKPISTGIGYRPLPMARPLSMGTSLKPLPSSTSSTSSGSTSTTVQVNLDVSLNGIKARLKAENFLNKLKNEQGLHDLSAVLLTKTKPIWTQLFARAEGLVLFMPLPLEADLQAFEELSLLAKTKRGSSLYGAFQQSRARMTRVKYGSSTDMQLGYANVPMGDGKAHLRYGRAMVGSVRGVAPTILATRHANALAYKTRVIGVDDKSGENNEVVVAYREHAGAFPVVGCPAKDGKEMLTLVNLELKEIGTLDINKGVVTMTKAETGPLTTTGTTIASSTSSTLSSTSTVSVVSTSTGSGTESTMAS